MVCVNCQSVTTNDGRTVWVCERCGVENPTASTTPADATTAQDEIMAAVATVPDVLTNPTPTIESPTATAPMSTFDQSPASTPPAPVAFTPSPIAAPETTAVQTPASTPTTPLNTPTS